jgi:hypothetical protein
LTVPPSTENNSVFSPITILSYITLNLMMKTHALLVIFAVLAATALGTTAMISPAMADDPFDGKGNPHDEPNFKDGNPHEGNQKGNPHRCPGSTCDD